MERWISVLVSRHWLMATIRDCSRVCDVGVLVDNCDSCICDGEIVTGRVLAADTSNPVSNTVFYGSSAPTKIIGESNFTLENVCPESELIVSRPGFVDAAVLVTTCYLLVNMSKTESEITSSRTQESDFTDFQSLPNVAHFGRTDEIYEIYAPTVYTPDLGLYSATSDKLDIESATNTAEGECISGAPQNLDDQNPASGVAVYFSLN